MSPTAKLGTQLLLTAALGGCVSHDDIHFANPSRPAPIVQKKSEVKLNDHLIGVATLSNADARLACKCLDKNHIPYGLFEDVGSTGIVVKEAEAEHARRLIREDSWNHGYKLLVRINPTPNPNQSFRDPQQTVQPPIIPQKAITNSASEQTKSIPKSSTKQVTVAAVADKDAKSALTSLANQGVKTPGTWSSRGITGIVVAETDAKKALTIIQNHAKAHGYNLRSTSAREPVAEPSHDWPGTAAKDDDSTAEGSLIVFTTQADAMKIAECLEGHSISSFSSCNHNSCGVYVSKHDAEHALAYVQEDARTRGYTYSSYRIHYSGK